MNEKIDLLRGDIRNAPSHVFGEHERCSDLQYFTCENRITDANLVPVMRECGIYDDLMSALQRLLDNTSSLIRNMDNNLAEHYNSVITKFIGGKRINYSLRGSYQTRCEAAAISFSSSGQYYRTLTKSACGASPKGFTRAYVERAKKLKAKRLFHKKKYKQSKRQAMADKDYGPNTNYVPLDINTDEFHQKATEFKSHLKKHKQEIIDIERSTIGQSSNARWIQERAIRLTASNFGKICKMRSRTSPINTIKHLLYGNFIGNNATTYGKESELRAIKDFEKIMNLNVSQCGFFVDEEHFYLGASPDGLVCEHDIPEIKCPYSIVKIQRKQF
nr:unnamed protein product [Callosobruchus analis]